MKKTPLSFFLFTKLIFLYFHLPEKVKKMKLHNNLLALLLLYFLFLNGCGSSNFANITELENQYQNSEKLIPENYPEDDAVIILKEEYIDLSIANGASGYSLQSESRVHSVTKLFKNIEEYANFKIYLYEGDNIKEIYARTVQEDGTESILEKRDFIYASGTKGNSTSSSTVSTVFFTFPRITKNCIIEFSYVLTKEKPFINDQWDIQTYIPIKKNIYELSLPISLITPEISGGFGWSWNFRTYNYFDMPNATERRPLNSSAGSLNSKIIFSWALEDIPAFESEPMMPNHDSFRSFMKFADGDWSTWNDVVKWYWEKYYSESTDLNEPIYEKATELTKGLTSDEEKIQALYTYAQNIRYHSIDLRESWLKPQKPVDVIKKSYGDCKDKSTLLLVLLKALKIESFPVLVSTRDNGLTDADFPSWNFNHMILKVKSPSGKVYWLDPTQRYSVLKEVPLSIEGVNALVITTPTTGKIEMIPASTAKENITKISQDISWCEGDSARFNVKINYSGDDNSAVRSAFKDKTRKEIVDFIKALLINDFGGIHVTSWNFSDLDSIHTPFQFEFTFTTASASNRQSDLMLLQADPFKLMTNMRWLNKEKRKYPVEFDQPYRIEKDTRIHPLGNFSTRNLPDGLSVENPNFLYKKNFSSDKDGTILATEIFEVKTRSIPASYYPQTKQFFDKVKAKLNERVIFTRN